MDRVREQFRIIQREMQATALLAHHRNSEQSTRQPVPDYAVQQIHLRRGNGRNIRLFCWSMVIRRRAFRALCE